MNCAEALHQASAVPQQVLQGPSGNGPQPYLHCFEHLVLGAATNLKRALLGKPRSGHEHRVEASAEKDSDV